MSQTTLSGKCFCGGVHYRINGEVSDAFFCHCESCRRSSGAPFVAWGRVNEHAFEITQGEVSKFNSSPDVTRGFCARCGTGITYQHDDYLPDLDFLLATLDAPEEVIPTYHIRMAEKLPWVQINDELPKYEGWRPQNA